MRRYLLDQSIEVLEVFSDHQQFNAEYENYKLDAPKSQP